MRYIDKISKCIDYIQNILYVICFVKIVFSLFFYEYQPEFFKKLTITIPILICVLILPIIKKKLR